MAFPSLPLDTRAKYVSGIPGVDTNNETATPAVRHDMSTAVARSAPWTIYPKRYFDAAPTWFKWNNLTIADVHSLRSEPGFEGQHIYFHRNHPIQFVRLVGIVVDIALAAEKYLLLSLDDGSGACIEVKTTLRTRSERDDAEYPSNTLVDNLNFHTSLGLPSVLVNNQPIGVGTVVKAKGTIDAFRDARQLKLERIWVVTETNEEVKAWSETANWKRDILSKPWVLTQEQRNKIDEQIRADSLQRQARAEKKRLRDAKDVERKKRRAHKMEKRRAQEETINNAGALPGSNEVPNRVTDS